MPAIVTFDPINLIITEIGVGGDNELQWQEIYSEWKDWLLADITRLGYPQAFRYVGADPVSPVMNLGTTFFLMNNWKVRPAELNHKLTLVGNCYVDGGVGSVAIPTIGAYTVVIELRVSNLTDASTAVATIQSTTTALRYLIESPNSGGAATGTVFYWDSQNGSDSNSGLDPDQACLTFAYIHDFLLVSGRHDTIFAIGTSTDERIVISKNNISLRCLGHDFNFVPIGTSSLPTIKVMDCEAISIQGGNIESSAGGSSGIRLERVSHCNISGALIHDVSGNGISLEAAEYTHIYDMLIQECAESGIFQTDCILTTLDNSIIRSCSTGFKDRAGGAGSSRESILDSTIFRNNSLYDIDIGTGCTQDTILIGVETYEDKILNNGTDTYIEETEHNLELADVIWDELLVGHTITGSFGNEAQITGFGNVITIDTVRGFGGTAYPIGTKGTPSNNYTDAKIIAAIHGINTFFIIGTYTFGPTDVLSGCFFVGEGQTISSIVLTSGCVTSNAIFQHLNISGRQNGETTYIQCKIGALENAHCFFDNCQIVGPITMHPTSQDQQQWIRCYSGKAADLATILDFYNGPMNMSIREFDGNLTIQNCTDSRADIVLSFETGKLILDTSVTAGNITIRGNCLVTRLDPGTALVFDETITNAQIANAVWEESVAAHTTTGTVGNILSITGSTVKINMALLLDKS